MWEGCPPGGSGPQSLTSSSIIVMRAPPLSRRAQLRCGEPRRKEGGGSREGVVLSVWVCCVCLRACVRGACVRVFTARRHAALWKLGREQRGCSGGRHYDSSRG